ncbi:MAG TPA: TetR family transcriptional regulator [Candidatus Binataceae bacterium]|nr:TetR family transcriptional regulator [Candidatus Binataceae bacterium]
MPARKRKTQAERSATTRERLLEAAIDCIVEHGYARTTTTMIARRARLTRGAQLHHFGNREQLIHAAISHLFERGLADFAAAFSIVPAGVDQNDAAIELAWNFFDGRMATAWIEILVAARRDSKLHKAVAEGGAKMNAELLKFGSSYSSLPLDEFAVSQTFEAALMIGLAVIGMNAPPDVFRAASTAVLEVLKEFIWSLAKDRALLRRALDRTSRRTIKGVRAR